MARLHPSVFPPILAKPAMAGERAIWQALLDAQIPDHVHLFYNRRPKGSHRPPDVLMLDATRGLIAIEVKGGMVHFSAKSFRQKIGTKARTYRKKIDPWMQARRALADLFKALALDPEAIPHAVILAAPVMHTSAYQFGESPHIITADDLAPERIAPKLAALLPVMPPPQQWSLAPAFETIARALSRKGD